MSPTPAETAAARSPEKQQRILEVATRIFAEQGFHNADTQAVADLAGVGKGTVYRYYRSKEELFLTVADNAISRLEEHVKAATDGVEDTLELIRGIAVSVAEFFQERPELIEILVLERAVFRGSIPDDHLIYRQQKRGLLEKVFRQGIEDGVLREMDVQQAARAFANLLFGTLVRDCEERSQHGLKDMAGLAVDVFLRGILPDRPPQKKG